MQAYVLMHKDIPAARFVLDDSSERVLKIQTSGCEPEYGPYLGNLTLENMKRWWAGRSIPGSREDLKDLLERAGCKTSGEYMAKNLALSLTDAYWVKPVGMTVQWSEVNLYDHMFSNGLNMHHENTYHTGSSLNGQMRKHWEKTGRSSKSCVLVKESKSDYGQRNINEAFAAKLHHEQGLKADLDYVQYRLRMYNGVCVASTCRAFTDQHQELVYAADLLYAKKSRNDESDFEKLIRVAGECGMDEESVRARMDYLFMSDFVMGNQDRHMNNFGFLRDSDTMEFIGMAPVYDTGNSMYYNAPYIMDRYELLSEPITSFSKNAAGSLRYISDRKKLDISCLPSAKEVEAFYVQYGVPLNRAGQIAANYDRKLRLFSEFQKGKTFSLYEERSAGRLAEG